MEKEIDAMKIIRKQLEEVGIDFSHYNPHQRAELILAYSTGSLDKEMEEKINWNKLISLAQRNGKTSFQLFKAIADVVGFSVEEFHNKLKKQSTTSKVVKR